MSTESRRFIRIAAAWLSVLVCAWGCGKTPLDKTPPKTEEGRRDRSEEVRVDFPALRLEIHRFCGACHAVPDPATFPKNAWYSEVAQGYRFYEESRRSDLHPPLMNSVVAYYRHFAPNKLDVPKVVQTVGAVNFQTRQVLWPEATGIPRVSQVAWHRILRTDRRELLFCDMRSGDVCRVDLSAAEPKPERLARLNHPAAIYPVEFDGNDRQGFVVAELGSFLPEDHAKGRVSWLRAKPDRSGFDSIILKSGLGRVADVRPADFDGDGRIDLVVAEFGWRKTGRILLLKQAELKDGVPQFQTIVLDKRHGTIHVPVVDLNDDGRPDFIALVSQEHEAIDAFLNKGNGQFERRRIYQANDPSFGSSGIDVVDLDRDGDLDVIYTNGDSLDSHYLKPYHAVHWLENRGTFPFKHHELTRLPGASRAVAVDLDGDGDLDVVCSSYLPPNIIDQQAGGKIDSLIWLEQRGKGRFVRHGIEQSHSGYLSIVAGDFNGDGAADFATGHFGTSPTRASLTLWLNRRSGKTPVRNRKKSVGQNRP
jgi:FG-GAP-like repeat